MTCTQRLDDLIHAHTTAHNIYSDHVTRWREIQANLDAQCASPAEYLAVADAIKSWEARVTEEAECIALFTELRASYVAEGKPDMVIPDPLERFGEAWWTYKDVLKAGKEEFGESFTVSQEDAEELLATIDEKLKDAMITRGWMLLEGVVFHKFKDKYKKEA